MYCCPEIEIASAIGDEVVCGAMIATDLQIEITKGGKKLGERYISACQK